MIHLIFDRANPQQIQEMLESLEAYIKVAVDIHHGILAGGGVLHSDCEAILLKEGSRQEDIWGANWIPDTREVRFEALINIRPKQRNRVMRIEDSNIRSRVEAIVRRAFEEPSEKS